MSSEGPNGRERQVSGATHERQAAEEPARAGLSRGREERSADRLRERDRNVCGEAQSRKPGRRAVDGRSLRAGKLQAGIGTSQVEQREPGSRRIDRRAVAWTPERAMASNCSTVIPSTPGL